MERIIAEFFTQPGVKDVVALIAGLSLSAGGLITLYRLRTSDDRAKDKAARQLRRMKSG